MEKKSFFIGDKSVFTQFENLEKWSFVFARFSKCHLVINEVGNIFFKVSRYSKNNYSSILSYLIQIKKVTWKKLWF